MLAVGCIEIAETGEKIKVVAHTKSNLAPHGASLSFEIDPDTGFRWTGECEITIDELFEGKTEPGKAESQFDKAERIIRTVLSSGISEAASFEDLAAKHNISLKTFQRAKSKLGVRSVKHGDIWHWELPIDAEYTVVYEDGQDTQDVKNRSDATQDGHCTSLSTLPVLPYAEKVKAV